MKHQPNTQSDPITNTQTTSDPTSDPDPKSKPQPKCPNCNRSNTIKFGFRKTGQGKIQTYQCKKCNRRFSTSDLKNIRYPPQMILNSISTYNLGHTIEEVNKTINRRFRTKTPRSTIHSWIKRYSDICTFTSTLRNRFTLDPNTIIYSKKFHHQQVYEFKYHQLKTNIAGKTFPQLRSYLKAIPNKCPNEPFQHGPRCSKMRIHVKPEKTGKSNQAPKLAELALILANTNHERHEKVENFFLTNDSATIAIEVPVYLYPNEFDINLTEPLSGHIDILQVRFNKIHILDFKPNVNQRDNKTVDQLFLYALALSKRTGIHLENFICAYFDQNNYFQFSIQ